MEMNSDAVEWAIWTPGLDAAGKAVLVALAYDYVDGEGNAIPFGEIAERAGVSTRSAIRIVKRLEEIGYIKRIHRTGSDRAQLPNLYLLECDRVYHRVKLMASEKYMREIA